MTGGILVVDKPAGWTSFDVCAKLRGLLGTRQIGHSGTLDPMATGVLPVFVGGASKAVDRQPNHDKTYLATIRLGLRTDTGDTTGETLETAPVTAGEKELLAVLPQFVGEQLQLPPMYSAVKVNGVKLCDAARKGITVERRARPITVYSIDYLGRVGDADYQLRVACSKGTYIRVLLEEIGKALGLPATMSALRRVKAGCWDESQAHTMEQLLEARESGTLQSLLLPVETAFAALPALHVNEGVRRHLENGCPTSRFKAEDGLYRVYDREEFLGLAKVESQVLKVEKLFPKRNEG